MTESDLLRLKTGSPIDLVNELREQIAELESPIPMLLWCPECHVRHVDSGEFATKPHHTHACQHCGMVWRPAIVATVGVYYLPGFKDAVEERQLKAKESQ